MMYTSNSDPMFVQQVVLWWSKGLSWADIATKMNKPIQEVEELPHRCSDLWLQAIQRATVVTQHELTLQMLVHLQTVLASTTDAKTLATLVTAITRLLKTALPNKVEPFPTPAPTPKPTPTPEPIEKRAEIQATLSSADLTRYHLLREQFPIFSDFVSQLQHREPTIYQKLATRNLLPKPIPTLTG